MSKQILLELNCIRLLPQDNIEEIAILAHLPLVPFKGSAKL